MKRKQLYFSVKDFAGIGTWLVIFVISMYLLPNTNEATKENSYLIIGLLLVYILCFMHFTQVHHLQHNSRSIAAVYLTQLISAFALMLLWPMSFFSILTVIWVAMLPRFFSFRNSILIVILVVTAWFTILGMVWNSSDVIIQALLYGTFHFFAIIMTLQTQQAEKANLKAQSLNKELQATQQLLTEASRQNERTRIARDLHDLLGHHLTALIINLQIATRISQGEAKEKITQCHMLAKLLLSDVREAVSTLRENQNLDLKTMINLMIENIPKLKINSTIDAHLNLEELTLAKILLSCVQESITNSLRHSNANECWLTITQIDQTLTMVYYDNGNISVPYREGNGLQGMRERVGEFGGKLTLKIFHDALKITINIPLTIHNG